MQREIVTEHLRQAVRALLRYHAERNIRPTVEVGVRVDYDPMNDQTHIRLDAGEHRHAAVIQGHTGVACDYLVRDAQELWRHLRTEHLVEHDPRVVTAREAIDDYHRCGIWDAARFAQLQAEHDHIDRRVRNEIDDQNWVRATVFQGQMTLRNTGIVQMHYDEATDFNPRWFRETPVPPPEQYYSNRRAQQAEAEKRGMELLLRHLTPAQRLDYEKHKHFYVTGCDTGKTYKIKTGTHMNVFEMGEKVRKVMRSRRWHPFKWSVDAAEQTYKEFEEVGCYCFVPEGGLCAGDVMLTQKISLETDERTALRVANHFPIRERDHRYPW